MVYFKCFEFVRSNLLAVVDKCSDRLYALYYSTFWFKLVYRLHNCNVENLDYL